MKKVLFILIFVLCLCGCSEEKLAEIKNVTCSEKEEVLKDKSAMLIDVRTKEEYEERHLKSAINIPYDTIVEELYTYGTIDFNTPIVVYCKSGGRSSEAAKALLEAGYKQIYDLGAMSNCE